MKKFLKRINRGLLLGGIVLAGFVVFVIVDTVSFKKNKPVIQDALQSYISDFENAGVYSGNDKKTFTDNTNMLISNHWTFTDEEFSGNLYYAYNQEEYKNMISFALSDSEDNASVSKYSAKVSNVDVSKAGPGYAIVSFDCQTVAEFNGNACIITPGDAMTASQYAYYGEDIPTGLSKMSLNGTYEAVMAEKDGKWRICYVNSYGWDTQITAVNEEGGNEE